MAGPLLMPGTGETSRRGMLLPHCVVTFRIWEFQHACVLTGVRSPHLKISRNSRQNGVSLVHSPHLTIEPHPQSNGHAEACVKAMKRLLIKTTANDRVGTDAFHKGLLEWRNRPTPGFGGLSAVRPVPAVITETRSCPDIPCHRVSCVPSQYKIEYKDNSDTTGPYGGIGVV